MGTYCLVYRHDLSTRFIVSEGRVNVRAMKDEGHNTVEILKKNKNKTSFSTLSKIESETKEIMIASKTISSPHLWVLHS